MGDNPGMIRNERTLTIKLDGKASLALARYQREMHPGRSLEAVAAYLVRDSLVGLGLLELPDQNRGKRAARK